MKPNEMIPVFDKFLKKKGLSFDAVIIGGTALSILGVISRETRDCDVLYPDIPDDILSASKEFAELHKLETNWLNNGPATLTRDLPEGWLLRSQDIFKGEALNLKTLGREDLLCTKLFAFCDRGFDFDDCLKLKPSKKELLKIRAWVTECDTNPDWPEHVNSTFDELAKKLGHEL